MKPIEVRAATTAAHACLALTAGLTVALCPVVVSDAVAEPVPVAPPLPFPVPPAPPYLDPAFYQPDPARVAAAQPGEILRARQVNLANFWLIPLNVKAWQLSYRSTNTRGEPIPAVATVIVPHRPAPTGERGLLAFQFAEDSLSVNCAPSYALQMGSLPNPLNPVIPFEFIELQAMLQLGHAVVVPDHQGPNSAYAVGPLGGRITLDAIRAAENFEPAGLPGPSTRAAMWGYSGGAIPTAHAAELQPEYAPELNLVGAAAGGLLADVAAGIDYNNGTSAFTGAVFGGLLGVASEYPEVDRFLDRYMNPLGQALRVVHEGQCVAVQFAGFPFLNIKGLFDYPGDPLRAPEVQGILAELALGNRGTPQSPLYLYQAPFDEAMPINAVNKLYDTYCADPDAQVSYTRDILAEHGIAAVAGAGSAAMWLNDRLNGVPAPEECSNRDVASQILDPGALAAFVGAIGQTLASALGVPV
ncbi:lipase family protein [Nocardia amikacinitolerans]|uniref:lipase family protein n=1 Tax=Nocardia amikacinitolerans TaxID=756689 RepID=UPI0020A4966B|nr:lipase family protein [Nocardia amikacinitolerans]MCP2278690.1 triacylglycerol lipase [Nocardia amikacinitolerans]MCP2298412.1 triacylglycerol lipase [Nocardia amikacinitolerans]